MIFVFGFVLGFAIVAVTGEIVRRLANRHNAALEQRLANGSDENPTRLST